MNSNLSKLLESTVLNEETKEAILEAWEQKITEAREEISNELREEFATRYDHDKKLVIEATDKLVRDSLKEELDELADDKKKLKESRIQYERMKANLAEAAQKFIKEKLSEEIKEFKTERKQVSEGLMKVQGFVQNQLSEELKEFAQDKTALIAERIEFHKSKNKVLSEAKRQYVESATKISEKVIREALKSEITQLRTDLAESKKKMFGQKLFEAFASEFMNSHYNEGSQVKKLSKVLENAKLKVQRLEESLKNKDKVILEAKEEAKTAKELRERSETLGNLLSPLNKGQRKIMQKMLESVATPKLQENFKKYLPLVLKEENSEDISGKSVLTENKKSYDGNRNGIVEEQIVNKQEEDTIVRLKTLSGIR